ncbi:MAG: polymer-forming cytoskeletal protein [Verrucomicrobiae bacterium]|nr:polymer-forming cytoskeletal protein [Verrucomicrobiae bacterium]
MAFDSKSFGLGNLVAGRFSSDAPSTTIPEETPVTSTSNHHKNYNTPTSVTPTETYSHIGGSQSPIITEDVELKGELAFTGELEFNGRFEGTLDSDGALTIGDRAIIKGNINASSAVVSGKVQGNIVVSGKAHIRSNAIIHGDIQASTIEIEEGASVNGKLTTKGDRETPNFNNIFTRLGGSNSKSSKGGSSNSSSAILTEK